MNKCIAVLLAMIAAGTLHAQTTSGTMMLGGNFNLYSTSYQGSNTKSNGVTFAPSFGYFLKDNFAIGASLSISNNSSGAGTTKDVNNAFGFGPFARFYKFTSNENFAFFAQAGLNFSAGKSDPAIGATTKTSSISLYVSPGFSYFFNKHWAGEFSISGLTFQSYDPDTSVDNNKSTTVQFGISSLSSSIGVRYYFGN
jgi:outer membrane protein